LPGLRPQASRTCTSPPSKPAVAPCPLRSVAAGSSRWLARPLWMDCLMLARLLESERAVLANLRGRKDGLRSTAYRTASAPEPLGSPSLRKTFWRSPSGVTAKPTLPSADRKTRPRASSSAVCSVRNSRWGLSPMAALNAA
jgi:hypothetical protein